jgi:hypothetical protein
VEEGLHILECLLLVHLGQGIKELVEVGANQVNLLVAVEAAHFGATFVNGLS